MVMNDRLTSLPSSHSWNKNISTLTLKRCQGHGCDQRARLYSRPSIYLVCILFITHQSEKKRLYVMHRPRRWEGGPHHGAKLTIVQGLHSFKVELVRITLQFWLWCGKLISIADTLIHNKTRNQRWHSPIDCPKTSDNQDRSHYATSQTSPSMRSPRMPGNPKFFGHQSAKTGSILATI